MSSNNLTTSKHIMSCTCVNCGNEHVPNCACGKCREKRIAEGTQEEYRRRTTAAAWAVVDAVHVPNCACGTCHAKRLANGTDTEYTRHLRAQTDASLRSMGNGSS